MTTAQVTPETIMTMLAGFAFRWTDEYDLQASVAEILTDAGVPFEREVRLNVRDRIDFLVGSTGIEVKVDGSPALAERQCRRYLRSERVDDVVLVSGKVRHQLIRVDRLHVLWVGGAL